MFIVYPKTAAIADYIGEYNHTFTDKQRAISAAKSMTEDTETPHVVAEISYIWDAATNYTEDGI
jgi:hypothetical protein